MHDVMHLGMNAIWLSYENPEREVSMKSPIMLRYVTKINHCSKDGFKPWGDLKI